MLLQCHLLSFTDITIFHKCRLSHHFWCKGLIMCSWMRLIDKKWSQIAKACNDSSFINKFSKYFMIEYFILAFSFIPQKWKSGPKQVSSWCQSVWYDRNPVWYPTHSYVGIAPFVNYSGRSNQIGALQIVLYWCSWHLHLWNAIKPVKKWTFCKL